MAVITLPEWLAELERVQEPSGDCMTSREIGKALGCGIEKVKGLLRVGIDSGNIVCERTQRVSIEGKTVPVAGYRVVKKKKSRKRHK